VNLIDIPLKENHKTHEKIVPVVGGLVLIIGLFVSKLLFTEELKFLNIHFISGSIVLLIIGLIDDINNLKARYKFLGQLLASILMYLGGFRVEIFFIIAIDATITIFWFVGLLNAFNFIDGGDGIATGSSIIIVFTILFLSFSISKQLDLTLFSFVLLIILLILYLKNKKPAKLFLGDSGSLLLGLFLSASVLYFAPFGYYKITSWIAPVLIFIFPIFDVTLVTISRIRRGVSVFEPGLDHTYHRLMLKTKDHRKSIKYIFLIVFISNILAILSLINTPAYGLLIGAGVLILFGYSIIRLESILSDYSN
jgi:UDP-GlcNAc:undecaprenyl-phosphate/decaprenyl-phosphate GlcNAc-1-phosphate transferase